MEEIMQSILEFEKQIINFSSKTQLSEFEK